MNCVHNKFLIHPNTNVNFTAEAFMVFLILILNSSSFCSTKYPDIFVFF